MSDNNKSIIRTIEAIATVIGVTASILACIWFLDARHAGSQIEFELKADLLDKEITRGNELRVYYENKISDGSADKADVRRKDYIDDELDRNYDEKALIEEKLLDLKD